MDKKELCKMFIDQLLQWRISHQCYNNDFHIQIQRIHNFYPTKRSYYNSETGDKCHYPEFKDGNDFLNWLSKKGAKLDSLQMRLTPKAILEILEDCEHLDDAKQYFNSL